MLPCTLRVTWSAASALYTCWVIASRGAAWNAPGGHAFKGWIAIWRSRRRWIIKGEGCSIRRKRAPNTNEGGVCKVWEGKIASHCGVIKREVQGGSEYVGVLVGKSSGKTDIKVWNEPQHIKLQGGTSSTATRRERQTASQCQEGRGSVVELRRRVSARALSTPWLSTSRAK